MNHSLYLDRCYQLAQLSNKKVGSNPNVGAVVVHRGKIIGEGYHKQLGSSHAEVEAINNIPDHLRHLLPSSSIYVSLEPCCHYGKTPPCTQYILDHKIPEVHVGMLDPFSKVNGKGVDLLRSKGVKVTVYNDKKAYDIIRPFLIHMEEARPMVTLKWAKSHDHFMGSKSKQIWLSNAYSKVHAHQLRAEHDAILVGTQTALLDNPSLTTRAFPGENPIRFVIDKELKIPKTHQIYSSESTTVIFNNHVNKKQGHLTYVKISEDQMIPGILDYCRQHQICRLLVEGGAKLLKSFINLSLWDRALIYKTQKVIKQGVAAPNLTGVLLSSLQVDDNEIMEILKKQ